MSSPTNQNSLPNRSVEVSKKSKPNRSLSSYQKPSDSTLPAYSFPYIGHWFTTVSDDLTIVQGTAERVIRYARTIIDALTPNEQ